MYNFVASCSNIPILGQIIDAIAFILGYLMSGIYWVFDTIGIANVGLCIILFTIIIKAALAPLTFKQQKFSKISSVINPEIQEIQKKYKDKKDNESMARMQAETKEVYSKYGTSQTGGCLQLVIQMPIIFALYQVIRSIPSYVPTVYSIYENIRGALSNNYITNVLGVSTSGESAEVTKSVVSKLAAFSADKWDSLIHAAGNTSAAVDIKNGYSDILQINSFLGMDLGETPWTMLKAGIIVAVLFPILSGVAQFLSTKLNPTTQTAANGQADQMASSMKTMNMVMPLVSVFFCFSLPAAIGLYWTMSSVCQVILQLIMNRHFNKIGMDVIIEKSKEKAIKKKKKKGISAKTVATAATTNTRKINTTAKSTETKIDDNAITTRKGTPKEGSLAAKAAMVKSYNEKNNKKK